MDQGDRVSLLAYERGTLPDGTTCVYDKRKRVTGVVTHVEITKSHARAKPVEILTVKLDSGQGLVHEIQNNVIAQRDGVRPA